jgi:hypothetical protein
MARQRSASVSRIAQTGLLHVNSSRKLSKTLRMILSGLPRRPGPTAVLSGVAAVLDVQRLHAAYTSAERQICAGTHHNLVILIS